MVKLNNKFIIKFTIIFLVLIFVGLFFVDIGINSNFFIKKHFNQAFKYRITGDCESFLNYIYSDNQKWKERCKYEKNKEKDPIRVFFIKEISHNFFSDRSFLQVELTRSKTPYTINYEMKKDGLLWKIDQQIDEP